MYTHMRKDLPQPPLRPAVLLAGRSSTDKRAYPALIPPAGDGRESRGTRPSGADCGRPPAAQADQTAISSAHEYKKEGGNHPPSALFMQDLFYWIACTAPTASPRSLMTVSIRACKSAESPASSPFIVFSRTSQYSLIRSEKSPQLLASAVCASS